MTEPSAYTYTIPSCLKSGYYLVRHEIIALHAAWEYPGAQFYPGCHQLEVTGGGSTVPSSNLVSFPGAYKGSDPGITYDAYKGESASPSVFLSFGPPLIPEFLSALLLKRPTDAEFVQSNLTPSLARPSLPAK